MTLCKVCKEKDKEIELLEKRVEAVITGHRDDKKLWAKQEKKIP